MSAWSLARPSVSRSGAVLVQPAAALVAEPRPQVVLAPAAAAAVGQLPARHGDEDALGALDDFQVADDERVVEGDRAEGQQPLAVLFHSLMRTSVMTTAGLLLRRVRG